MTHAGQGQAEQGRRSYERARSDQLPPFHDESDVIELRPLPSQDTSETGEDR